MILTIKPSLKLAPSLPTLVNVKGKMPRKSLWIAKEKIGGEWTDEITRLIDGIAADLAKN